MKIVNYWTNQANKAIYKPFFLIVLLPILSSLFGGFDAMCSLLIGIIVSGLLIGISFINSGYAWENAKKYI